MKLSKDKIYLIMAEQNLFQKDLAYSFKRKELPGKNSTQNSKGFRSRCNKYFRIIITVLCRAGMNRQMVNTVGLEGRSDF